MGITGNSELKEHLARVQGRKTNTVFVLKQKQRLVDALRHFDGMGLDGVQTRLELFPQSSAAFIVSVRGAVRNLVDAGVL